VIEDVRTELMPVAGGVGTAMPEGGEGYSSGSVWRLILAVFLENRLAIVGLGLIVFMVLFSFVGPLVYHTQQVFNNPNIANLPPSIHHPLGTDPVGYDMLGRLMLGGQSSLEIGFAAALIAVGIGVIWGATAGLAGGVVDAVMMRIVDALLSIPFLFVVLILATRYGASVVNLSIVIGIFSWLVPSRLVRGEVLTLRTRDFVSAARVMGASRSRLTMRHLIPNALSVIIVNITFQVADAILALAFLGFLGFGLNYPHVDWGDMLSGAETALQDGYWWQVYPVGVALIMTVMAVNFIGDALRDAMDVRLRRR